MYKKITRRAWGGLTLTALAGIFLTKYSYLYGMSSHLKSSNFKVIIGVQTYSFRDRSLDKAIEGMKVLNVRSCELWHGHIEPRELMWSPHSTPTEVKAKREKLKKWRSEVDLEKINEISDLFRQNGIKIQAYNCNIKDNVTDEEIDSIFKITKALGANILTTSATVSMMPRIDTFAQKYNITVGMHNHDHIEDANEFATPESFKRGMQGVSDLIKINLDIGHFTASNYDALQFISQNHENIVCIHLKDRNKNKGAAVPFGKGETPIKEVLELLQAKKWNIPANIEYEYKGKDTMLEIEKCLTYCRNILKN